MYKLLVYAPCSWTTLVNPLSLVDVTEATLRSQHDAMGDAGVPLSSRKTQMPTAAPRGTPSAEQCCG